jgi:sensor histidine kinase YesM
MRIFLNVAAVVAVLLGLLALKSMRSDIQLIVAVVCFCSAVIMLGLATLIRTAANLNARLEGLELAASRQEKLDHSAALSTARGKPMRWPEP